MKTKIIIYSLLFLLIAGIAYLVIARRQVPTGLSTGEIKSYTIVKRYTYEGTASGLLVNEKGFVFAANTSDRILITQTDLNGKKIFTSREPIVNRGAEINNLDMATNPLGARLCAVWTELLNKNTKLYYKFFDMESENQSEAIEISETNPISYLNMFYNSTNDEFVIIYLAKNVPKLVIIDSLGFNKSPVSLSFELTPDVIDMIWNGYDNLYALVTPKRLVQFDINGNLIGDNNIVIDNITKPSNIRIYYSSIDNCYDIFISQKDILYITAIDNQGNVLNTVQKKLPDTSSIDFTVVDNGHLYDIFYLSEIMKRVIHTTASYEDEFSNKYHKVTDAEGKNPSAILSNGKLGILYTTAGGSPESVLCMAVQGDWGAGKKGDIAAFGGRFAPPATRDGGGGDGRREPMYVIKGPDYSPATLMFKGYGVKKVHVDRVDKDDVTLEVNFIDNLTNPERVQFTIKHARLKNPREYTLGQNEKGLFWIYPDFLFRMDIGLMDPINRRLFLKISPLLVKDKKVIWARGLPENPNNEILLLYKRRFTSFPEGPDPFIIQLDLDYRLDFWWKTKYIYFVLFLIGKAGNEVKVYDGTLENHIAFIDAGDIVIDPVYKYSKCGLRIYYEDPGDMLQLHIIPIKKRLWDFTSKNRKQVTLGKGTSFGYKEEFRFKVKDKEYVLTISDFYDIKGHKVAGLRIDNQKDFFLKLAEKDRKIININGVPISFRVVSWKDSWAELDKQPGVRLEISNASETGNAAFSGREVTSMGGRPVNVVGQT